MKILVTGGTGFLGKNVARSLAADGHELRILARRSSNLSGLPPSAETVEGDVRDIASLRRAASGCAAIAHMAALVKMWVPDRAEFSRVNVGGLKNVIEVASETGSRVLYTSSFIAVGPTSAEPADESRPHPGGGYRNAYEETKAQADALARQAAQGGADLVILYPGVVYGPGDLTEGNLVVKMVVDHIEGRLPGIIGPGDRLWSYAFVEDVARAHAAALKTAARGERYFLCGPNVTMNELFQVVQALTGRPVPTRHIPYPAATSLGFLLWLWAELTGHPPVLTHEVVGVFRHHWAYSSAKAERDLGYRPTPLAEGLGKTLAWLKETGRLG